MEEVNSETDLPLTANVKDIRARHYLLSLEQKPAEQVFLCEAVIFLETLRPLADDFTCVLDCCDLDFQSVSKLALPTSLSASLASNFSSATASFPRTRDFVDSCLAFSKQPLEACFCWQQFDSKSNFFAYFLFSNYCKY